MSSRAARWSLILAAGGSIAAAIAMTFGPAGNPPASAAVAAVESLDISTSTQARKQGRVFTAASHIHHTFQDLAAEADGLSPARVPERSFKLASADPGAAIEIARERTRAQADVRIPLPRERARLDEGKDASPQQSLASLTPPTQLPERPAGNEDLTQGRTAIYDIQARIVYLPNGERLEAHSGLASMRDDPRYIAEKMRGPTPPNVYTLTMRERLFHGVEAIRLNPVRGDEMHGRAGILAHPYMLGPAGDSNGCVSVKNYDRFLQAFKRGEINRLVVISNQSGRPVQVASVGAREATSGVEQGSGR